MLSCLLLFFCTLLSTEPTVAHLEPPIISSETVAAYVRCTRPLREGKFNISVEEKEGKTVVHCYGFGRSGWTCLFGAVNKAVTLFEQTLPSKETPIRVLGSGCMGLTSAVELSRRGYTVVGVTTKDLYNNPSWKAGGLFEVAATKSGPEEEKNIQEISAFSFLTYRQIETGEHPYLPCGDARLLPVYFPQGAGKALGYLEQVGLVPPREEVTLDFGNGAVYPNFAKCLTYFIDTGRIMLHLLKEMERLGIPIDIKEVSSFHDVAEEVVFNCTGLGSFELNEDANLIPLHGHLIMLNSKSGDGHMDYMIGVKLQHPNFSGWVNLFPKSLYVDAEHPEGIECRGVLGSTFYFEYENWTDEEEFAKLADRTSFFFTQKPFE
jgi:hypothetical protein